MLRPETSGMALVHANKHIYKHTHGCINIISNYIGSPLPFVYKNRPMNIYMSELHARMECTAHWRNTMASD